MIPTRLRQRFRETPGHRLIAAALVLLCAPGSGPAQAQPRAITPAPPDRSGIGRPDPRASLPLLPLERPEHRRLELWLQAARLQARPEQVVIPQAALRRLNAAIRRLVDGQRPIGRWDLWSRPVEQRLVTAELSRRLLELRRRVKAGTLWQADGQPPDSLLARAEEIACQASPANELRVAHRSVALRVLPTALPLFEEPVPSQFDQLQETQLRPGEAVRVVRRAGEHGFVWTDHAEGWVELGALTPPLASREARSYLKPARLAVVTRDGQAVRSSSGAELYRVDLGARLPLLGARGEDLLVKAATPAGLVTGRLRRGPGVRRGHAPLSRASLLEGAFSLLGNPYAWGGQGGGRDCSQTLMDLFAVHGLHLPRNSSEQARSGRQHDVSSLDDAARRELIRREAARGLLLLRTPGHIMLYLGEDRGSLFVFHQFSGYPRRSRRDPTQDEIHRADRTAVTSLDLGADSNRGSFLRRLTSITVIEP